ncbi:MAG: type II toxin-antitoxin system VapC family toxin [Solirubrobacterales bacterium]
MILDTSAVITVLFRERGHERVAEAMDTADLLAIGAPTLLETGIVTVGAFDLHGRALVSQFLEQRQVTVVPFDKRHWSVAAEAFIRYGKGRHPARLNYGDCMTYATAKVAGAPLLFVGNDFAQTDVSAA